MVYTWLAPPYFVILPSYYFTAPLRHARLCYAAQPSPSSPPALRDSAEHELREFSFHTVRMLFYAQRSRRLTFEHAHATQVVFITLPRHALLVAERDAR